MQVSHHFIRIYMCRGKQIVKNKVKKEEFIMVYGGVVAPAQITEQLNNVHYDVKAAMKENQNEINDILDQMSDPNLTSITVDGRKISKTDTVTLQLAISNKMDQLSNQTTTILSVFQQMFALEKSIGSSSS